ncbi:hypothetical protein [Paenibacillus polymyxa]|uniref:Uncharacterized protein n=1 Tax=Paenibacillus polymyxa TaxID=1406 RepID=A0AAE9IEM6_PAEPO|nr:hypothetical protein [Paenibacillus polymyxa]URJ48655.1 hypothetical protein MF626_002927 [Paenibacillus polymyxa]
MLINLPKRERGPRVHKNINTLLAKYLKDCKKQNRLCSMEDFFVQSGISPGTLHDSGLNHLIAASRKSFQEKDDEAQISKCWKAAEQFESQ